MRVLVTGAAGFIGSHACERLLAEGHEVVGLDCFTNYYGREIKERNLERSLGHDGFRFFELDLRTDGLDEAISGCEAVIHQAAMAGLLRSWTDFDAYASCNLMATHRLIEACRRHDVTRFVHVSTSSVYGVDAVGDEATPLQPTSPYGVTKLAAEKLVLAYAQTHGFPALVVRYFSIYGPRQRPDMGYHRFIEAMLDDTLITVHGDGRQTRSNTYVSDCVDGTVAALSGGAVGEAYNIAGGEAVSVLDVLLILRDLIGAEPRIEHGAPRPGDQRHTRAETGKAGATFGYEPKVSARDGLAAQVEWHRSLRR